MTEYDVRTSTFKAFQDLTFVDDFMFKAVLMSNESLCIRLIELLLDVRVDHIVYRDEDKPFKFNSDIKSVRVDVYLKDDIGSVFDLEMQARFEKDLPKRSRYYQSVIDRSHLKRGADYGKLPQSYVVFICVFDPFDHNMHKYTFRELCVEDPKIELGDETSKVFINAQGKRDEASGEMRAFLDYLCNGEASSELTRDIDDQIADVKKSRSLEEDYMTFKDEMDRIEREALARGEEIGEKRGEDNILSMGKYLTEQDRLDDLTRAFEDADFRASIIAEMQSGRGE